MGLGAERRIERVQKVAQWERDNFYEAKVALQRCWESIVDEQPLQALGALEKELFDPPSGLHWDH